LTLFAIVEMLICQVRHLEP